MRHLVLVEFYRAETAHSRSVDYPSATLSREGKHLGKCGGMHAGVVHVGYLAGFQVEARYQAVDECGFAHTGVARHECHFSSERVAQRFQPFTGARRYVDHPVSYRAVEISYSLQQFGAPVLFVPLLFVLEQIHFVDDKYGRHPVCLARGQEAVDESGGCRWMCQCGHQACLVYVGRKYARLF